MRDIPAVAYTATSMKWLLAVVLVLVFCGTAAAGDIVDQPTGGQDDALLEEPEIGPRASMSEQITNKLTLFSHEVGLHLAALSADMIGMEVDVGERTAHLRFGGNYSSHVLLRLDSDVVFASGRARVKARLDLGIIGHRLSLALPEVDVVPRSVAGTRYLELRLPLFEGHF